MSEHLPECWTDPDRDWHGCICPQLRAVEERMLAGVSQAIENAYMNGRNDALIGE